MVMLKFQSDNVVCLRFLGKQNSHGLLFQGVTQTARDRT